MSADTPPLDIPQAVIERNATGPRIVGRSPGFHFQLEEEALRTSARFGNRPEGVICPHAVFALPAGKTDRIFVVSVADLTNEIANPPLRFRYLALSRQLYHYLGDPFAILKHLQVARSSSELPDLEWPAHPLPVRRVEDLAELLRTGDGPLLLGATQALLDDSRIALIRDEPQNDSVRGVWQLLPDRIRAERWPATFTFSLELGCDLCVLPPQVLKSAPPGWLNEDRVKDYPEGRYELAMQIATDQGDQAELDRLLARRTSSDVLRTAVGMVLFAVVVVIILRLL